LAVQKLQSCHDDKPPRLSQLTAELALHDLRRSPAAVPVSLMLARGIAVLFHVVPTDPPILRGSDVYSHVVTLHLDDAHGDVLTNREAVPRLSGKR